jgi:hypothetical protein
MAKLRYVPARGARRLVRTMAEENAAIARSEATKQPSLSSLGFWIASLRSQ